LLHHLKESARFEVFLVRADVLHRDLLRRGLIAFAFLGGLILMLSSFTFIIR
jgi:hypothetical protein